MTRYKPVEVREPVSVPVGFQIIQVFESWGDVCALWKTRNGSQNFRKLFIIGPKIFDGLACPRTLDGDLDFRQVGSRILSLLRCQFFALGSHKAGGVGDSIEQHSHIKGLAIDARCRSGLGRGEGRSWRGGRFWWLRLRHATCKAGKRRHQEGIFRLPSHNELGVLWLQKSPQQKRDNREKGDGLSQAFRRRTQTPDKRGCLLDCQPPFMCRR